MNKGWVAIAEELEIHGRSYKGMLYIEDVGEKYFSAARALRAGDPVEAMGLYEQLHQELLEREQFEAFARLWCEPARARIRRILNDLGYEPQIVKEWLRERRRKLEIGAGATY